MATQKTIRERDYTSCKIYMVEKGTLERGPKSGGKEKLGEEEWVSLNTLSLKKIKIRQERRREGVFVCLGIKEMKGLYGSDGGNMNGMPFNEGWQRIINLDLILALEKI